VRLNLLRPLDFFSIGLSAALTVLSAFMVYGRPRDASRVIVQGETKTWVFPLDAEETLTVPGPIGDTVVEISGGRSRVRSSPCTNQTCVASGHIYRRGQWTACLPNKVFLYVEGIGNDTGVLDSTTW
jgi:hypothetical protein